MNRHESMTQLLSHIHTCRPARGAVLGTTKAGRHNLRTLIRRRPIESGDGAADETGKILRSQRRVRRVSWPKSPPTSEKEEPLVAMPGAPSSF